jgi:IS5 family transposase
VAGLNEALLAKAAQAKLLRTDRVRADTTVVAADVAYPTDTGLLAKAVGKIARTVQRVKAAGGAPRTKSRDRRRDAGRRARSIASKLRLRAAVQRDEAQRRRVTGELADLAEAASREADAVLRNARRALRPATGQTKGRLGRAVQELDTTLARTRQVVEQARTRVAGQMPDSRSRLVSLHDPDARPIRKGRLGKPVESGYKPRSWTTSTGGHPGPHRRDREPGRRAPAGSGDRTDHPPRQSRTTRGHRRPRLRRSQRRAGSARAGSAASCHTA